jgi:hypothetical protein
MLAVVIEKALQWKEMTMRTKWLWTTWAYLGVVGVIVLEVLFLTFLTLMIVPKYQKMLHDGMIDQAIVEEHELEWMPGFLFGLKDVMEGSLMLPALVIVAVLWGLFEWRVKSENKHLMRLAALGTAAVGLMVVVVLAAGALVISFCLAMPAMGELSRPFALEQVAAIETSTGALGEALAQKDWKTAQAQAELTSGALHRLAHGPALKSLTRIGEPPAVEELRAHVQAAHQHLRAAQQAIAAQDAQRTEATLAQFRREFAPVLEASKRPAP